MGTFKATICIQKRMTEYTTMKISELLKARRSELQISQSELAERLTRLGKNTLKASVGHWETERTKPSLDDPSFVLALAIALEMDVNSMLQQMDYHVGTEQFSPEARRAAELIEHLSPEKRDLALRLIEQLIP